MRSAVTGALVLVVCVGIVGCGPSHVARVNCGADKESFDKGNSRWLADRELAGEATWGAVGGMTVTRTGLKIDSPRASLYLTERYDMTAYQFSVENGRYLVRLHFAETYERLTKAGERVFTVKVNGKEALKDLDVLKEAGGFAKPLVKEIDDVEVTDGKLRIEFVAKVQKTEVNAIEVLKY